MIRGFPPMPHRVLGYTRTNVAVEIIPVDNSENNTLHTYLIKPDPSSTGWHQTKLLKHWSMYSPVGNQMGIVLTIANINDGSYERLKELLDNTFG